MKRNATIFAVLYLLLLIAVAVFSVKYRIAAIAVLPTPIALLLVLYRPANWRQVDAETTKLLDSENKEEHP